MIKEGGGGYPNYNFLSRGRGISSKRSQRVIIDRGLEEEERLKNKVIFSLLYQINVPICRLYKKLFNPIFTFHFIHISRDQIGGRVGIDQKIIFDHKG